MKEIADLDDSDTRRGMAVWYKIAEEDEPRTVNATWNGLEDRHNLLMVQEFEQAFEGEYELEAYSAESSDAAVDSLSMGDVSAPEESLVLGVNSVRSDAGNASWNSLGNSIHALGAETYPKTIQSAHAFSEGSSEKSYEVSWTGESGNALGSVLVFKPEDSFSSDISFGWEKDSEGEDWIDSPGFEDKGDWFDEKEKKGGEKEKPGEGKEENETVRWQVDFAEGEISSPPSYYPRDLMAALGNSEDGVTENPANLRQDRQGELAEVQIEDKEFQFNGDNPTQATVSFTIEEGAEDRKLHLASFKLPGPFDIDEFDQQELYDKEIRTFEPGETANMTVQLPTQ